MPISYNLNLDCGQQVTLHQSRLTCWLTILLHDNGACLDLQCQAQGSRPI